MFYTYRGNESTGGKNVPNLSTNDDIEPSGNDTGHSVQNDGNVMMNDTVDVVMTGYAGYVSS